MRRTKPWLLALALLLGGFTLLSAAESQACSRFHHKKHKHSYHRYHDYRVNTPIEAKYDLNRNGYIGWRERYAMNHRYVNTWKERRCDYNRNGVVDAREVACVY
ncbi:hypothetical protein FBR05_14280 [Deltaproteobacteria bacterium PRO3]|nr:hypothetical protein [Deltaproteobacteria bacterium PRO3]